MSDHSKVDPVKSGVDYIVTSVNDAQPKSFDDFVTRPVIAVTVASHDQVVQIHGCAHVDGDTVVVHEKDEDGTGKDVRIWSIRVQDRQFVAVQPSLY